MRFKYTLLSFHNKCVKTGIIEYQV